MKTKWMKPILWASVLVAGVVFALFVIKRLRVEGFEDGPLASNSALAPSDTAGATTENPTQSNPQDTDAQAFLTTVDTFMTHFAALPAGEQAKYVELKDGIPSLRDTVMMATPEQLTLKRAQYEAAIAQMRNPATAGATAADATYMELLDSQATPTVAAGTPGLITLVELRDLVKRIQEEKTRIENLRTTSATYTARKDQLEKLAADVSGIISDVEQGKMKLEDVPIRSEDATNFLAKLPNTALPLSTLISPAGSVNSTIKVADAAVMDMPAGSMDANVLQGLLTNAQYLKWQINVEFDPALAERDRILKRLEMMERRLTNLLVSETPIPKEMYDMYVQELKTLQAMLLSDKQSVAPIQRLQPLPIEHTRMSVPDERLAAAVAAGNTNGAAANANDAAIRPGFVMNDDMIARRASASTFDDSTVGGPDYKERALGLCRQIQGAQLGDPAEFGCIANPDTVGPMYSWKGNYMMVCNRIGNTWGGWYPEMFGCAKYDPTAKFKATMM
jgi:hypothetical protein